MQLGKWSALALRSVVASTVEALESLAKVNFRVPRKIYLREPFIRRLHIVYADVSVFLLKTETLHSLCVSDASASNCSGSVGHFYD